MDIGRLVLLLCNFSNIWSSGLKCTLPCCNLTWVISWLEESPQVLEQDFVLTVVPQLLILDLHCLSVPRYVLIFISMFIFRVAEWHRPFQLKLLFCMAWSTKILQFFLPNWFIILEQLSYKWSNSHYFCMIFQTCRLDTCYVLKKCDDIAPDLFTNKLQYWKSIFLDFMSIIPQTFSLY